MTQAFFNSVRKLNFYNFKSKYISQNDSMGEFLKKLTIEEFGSIPEPSCMDFDGLLSLLAIGNKKGIVKIYGRPGVSFIGHLDLLDEIWNVKFITGTNYLTTLTSENKLTLWLIQPSSRELLKIDSITNLTNPTNQVNIEQLMHADYNNNLDKASPLNITAIEYIDITSSIIMGNGEGSLILVKLDLMHMQKRLESLSNNQRSVPPDNVWYHPTAADVITKDRIIQKLPIGSQSRVQLEAIVHISARPGSRKQLLLGFNSGHSVVYDLQDDTVKYLLSSPAVLNNLCWCPPNPVVQDNFFLSPTNARPQYQLSNRVISCHDDGSLIRWTLPLNDDAFLAMNSRPIFPFGDRSKCLTVSNIKWKSHHRGDLIIFAGGLPRADYMTKSTITVMLSDHLENIATAKDTDSRYVVFDLTSQLIEFQTIDDYETNYAQYLMVLTEEEFLIVNLLDDDWPIMYNQQPYLNCLHHSPITAYQFLTNVSAQWFKKLKEMTKQLSVTSRDQSFVNWPIKGELHSSKRNSCDLELWQNDLMIIGHGDGSIGFWRLGRGGCLLHLTTIKSAQFFKNQEEAVADFREYEDEVIPFKKAGVFDPCCDDNRLAIQIIHYTGHNLLVGGCAGQIILWGFVDDNYQQQLVEIDLTTHLPNFQWKGCQAMELADINTTRCRHSFKAMMTMLIFPPSQITTLDILDDSSYNNQILVALGTLHGLAVVSCSKNVNIDACVITTHCTIPKNGAASQEAALGEGWARRRTRELKKSLRNSFRKLRRKSTRRMEHPAAKRNQSANADSSGLKVELVENDVDFEERVVEDRPKDTANNGLVRSIKISISSCTKKSTIIGGERYLNLFAGSSGGLLLWFQSDMRIDTAQPNNSIKLRLLKQYQLQHSAPVLYLNLIGQDHSDSGFVRTDASDAVDDRNRTEDRLDQLIVVTEEQVRLYLLPGFTLKHKLRITANEGYRLKNAHMVLLQDEKSNTNKLCKDSFISIINNGGQMLLLNTLNLRRKDVVQFVDKVDLMALSYTCLATCCDNGPRSAINRSVTPFGIHYSGHGQVTLFEIIPKSKNAGLSSSGYLRK